MASEAEEPNLIKKLDPEEGTHFEKRSLSTLPTASKNVIQPAVSSLTVNQIASGEAEFAH